MRETLIHGGTLVTHDERRRIFTGNLLIRGNKIAAVEPHVGRARSRSSLRRVIDARGCVVIPGLIQAHVHLCQTLLRNQAEDLPLLDWLSQKVWPFEARHTPATLASSAALGIAEMIGCGVTAALDMGTVHHTRAIFEVAQNTGFRIITGNAIMDETARAAEASGGPVVLGVSGRDALLESDRLIAKWHGAADGRLHFAYAPRFILSTTDDTAREVATLAARRHLLVHTHASEHPAEVRAVAARYGGKSNIAALADLGLLASNARIAHGVHLDDEDRLLLSRSGAVIVHCPSSNLKLGSGIADVPALLAAGIPVALGSDGAPCNNALDIFRELRLAALLPKTRYGPAAFSARAVFDLATLGGAHALLASRSLGSLEPGKLADVVVLDFANALHTTPTLASDLYTALVYAADPRNVRDVLIDGTPVLLDRKHTTLDISATRKDAQMALATLQP